MRHLFHSLRAALLLFALTVANSTLAYDVEIDGIYYDFIDSYISEAYDDGGNLEFDGILFEDGVFVTSGENKYVGEVIIPATVTYNNKTYRVTGITRSAFIFCGELTGVILPNTVTFIGRNAFFNCQNLTKVVLSQSLRHIDSNAFVLCKSLKTIDLPASLKTIGYGAFYDTAIKNITIPDSTIVGEEAFNNTPIENITVSCKAKLMGNHIFNNTSWMNNQPSDELIYIGTHLYCYNGILPEGTSITIPEGTTGIAGGAFAPFRNNAEDYPGTNQGLKNIEIPNSVNYIGNEAFTRSQLTEAVIPNSIEHIGDEAFAECTSLISANVPSAVKEIKPGTFRDCKFMRSVSFEEGLETIGGEAFSGDERLNDIVIPNSVKLIGWNAFGNCSALRTLFLNCDSIDYGAFKDCTALTRITIGDNTRSIGDEAFKGAPLNEINLGSSIKYVGKFAFSNNQVPANVTCLATTPPAIRDGDEVIDDGYGRCYGTFNSDCYTKGTLYVPKGSEEAYMTAATWKFFAYIVGIDVDHDNGDVNGDGEVNIADINVLVNDILSGTYDEKHDLNGDGEVNIADINELIHIILGSN